MKILIVDDNRGTLNALRIGLTSFGHAVITASSGAQALRIIVETIHDKERPDLLLTDMDMPSMNGIELMEKVRIELANSETPIIVCTAEDNITEEELFGKGANLVLKKPVSPIQLMEAVAKLI